jgi:hypothetical protein
MVYKFSSAKDALVMNGKGAHILNPWHITINLAKETIEVKKRNSFLIGVDENVVNFKRVRSIKIDQHLIGADIHIKVVGGSLSVYCLSKSDAKKIKNILLEFNDSQKESNFIIS